MEQEVGQSEASLKWVRLVAPPGGSFSYTITVTTTVWPLKGPVMNYYCEKDERKHFQNSDLWFHTLSIQKKKAVFFSLFEEFCFSDMTLSL